MSGCQDEISDAPRIDFGFIESTGCDIEPSSFDVLEDEILLEAVDRITAFFLWGMISCDPLCQEVFFRKKTRFEKGCLGFFTLDIIFIPKDDIPKYVLTRR